MDTVLAVASVWLALTLCVGLLIGRAIRRAGQEPDDAVLDGAVLAESPTADVPRVAPDAERPATLPGTEQPTRDQAHPPVPAARGPVAEEQPLAAPDGTDRNHVPKVA